MYGKKKLSARIIPGVVPEQTSDIRSLRESMGVVQLKNKKNKKTIALKTDSPNQTLLLQEDDQEYCPWEEEDNEKGILVANSQVNIKKLNDDEGISTFYNKKLK